MKKRWSSALLAGALALSLLATPAQAIWWTEDSYGVQTVESGLWFEEPDFSVALYPASILYSYGLVNGTGTDSVDTIRTDVGQSLTRQEAVTLLVRMLGLEQEATTGQWDTPFTDVTGWAAPYVGCAYAKGMAAGTSATAFSGQDPITMEQFLTLMLRALGYSDAQGDFSWQDPYALADQVGLLCPLFSGEGFLRGDAMFICYEALDARPKGSDATLLEQLTAQGAIHRRGTPILTPTTYLKADYDTLPQQLDYLRQEFGTTQVYIDFSDYPSLTSFTDQFWDYCHQRGYWASWPSEIINGGTSQTQEVWQQYQQAMEGLMQVDAPFVDRLSAQYPGVEPREVEDSAWYEAEAAYLADKLPRETWCQMVLLQDAASTLAQELVFPDTRLYAQRGIVNSDYWWSPHPYYSCTPLSGEGREGAYMLQATEELWQLYQQLVDEDMSDYQKVKAIYDGIIARTDYNDSVYDKYKDVGYDTDESIWNEMLNDPEFILAHTWLGVVKGSDVVCEGYSHVISRLLDIAGIPNLIVTGESDEEGGHAWNKVLLDGKWYNLDATWGDGDVSSSYFLRSDQAFRRDGHEVYGRDGTAWDELLFPASQDYR